MNTYISKKDLKTGKWCVVNRWSKWVHYVRNSRKEAIEAAKILNNPSR